MSVARRRLWEEGVRPKLDGRVSDSVMLFIGRAYYDGFLNKPIEEVSDVEFLSLRGFGPKTLAQIRRVIPAPKYPDEASIKALGEAQNPFAIEEEGRQIARQLGIRYVGPQYGKNDEFVAHLFKDVAVTNTSFLANTLQKASTRLAKRRRLFSIRK